MSHPIPEHPHRGTVLTVSSALLIVVWFDRIELPLVSRRSIGRQELALIHEISMALHENIHSAIEVVANCAQDEALSKLGNRLVFRGGIIETDVAEPQRRVSTDAADTMHGSSPIINSEELLCLESPLTLRPVHGRFEYVGHDGRLLLSLSVDEVLCLPLLATGGRLSETGPALEEISGLTRQTIDDLCSRLLATGLLRITEPKDKVCVPGEANRLMQRAFAIAAERADDAERAREARTEHNRIKVIPVSFTSGPPLALGLIFAFCAAQENARLGEAFDFRHDWEWDDARLDTHTNRPAVYLCSAYVWSHLEVLRVAAAVKERSPHSLIVVGGPDVPKREAATLDYLREHSQIDVVVRGEGEWSAFDLLSTLAADDSNNGLDPALLTGIPGVTVRAAGGVSRGPERQRMKDLNVVPSPFLTGIFETYASAPLDQVILESNRGCPYGCTFCDWGSATLSKIRKFDLDRVLAEIAWTARAKARVISFADANFGIFARDMKITEAVVAAHTDSTYPEAFGANFAKNTVEYLRPIIHTLVEGGIINRGLLALQTMDETTLNTIDRANIPVAKYENIATEMRAAGLPFAVELMMGLPGATVASFKADLQQCIDREIEGTVNPTSVLVNSPMNSPAYLTQHQIETAQPVSAGRHALLISTESFSRDEYTQMCNLRQAFLLTENFGMTRHINRLLRYTTGIREIDFLEKLHSDLTSKVVPDYPLLATLFRRQVNALVVPLSWQLVMDELVDYTHVNFPDIDRASLRTVAQVQHALLPAFDRRYPQTIELEYDYPAWFAQMLALKEAGARSNWPELLQPLHTFPAGVLHVDDPRRNARMNIGCSIDHGPLLATWEHASEVGRALYLVREPTEPQADTCST